MTPNALKETPMFILTLRRALTILALLLSAQALAAPAAPAPAAIPTLTATSDDFEVVGRLLPEGLVLYVDRADTNAPVLGATLELEQGGRTAPATFRPERGDYLLADAAWLAALRQPGHLPIAITLLADKDSDLLSSELHVEEGNDATSLNFAAWAKRLPWLLAALILAAAGWRYRNALRRQLQQRFTREENR